MLFRSFSKKYGIDCFVQSKQFGVEYCGEYWHRYEPHKKNKKYHIDKYLFFYNQGIKVFTIFEHEWKNKKKQNILKSMISQRLDHVSTKIYGRKCELKEIDKKQAESFHEDNHISGKTTSTINIGLFFDNKLISVLSFVKSRFDKNYEYEISRFSTLLSHIVVGGFSKMFNYFSKKYNVKSCMTYADLRFGEGKVYVIKDGQGAASLTNYIRLQPVNSEVIEGLSYYDINAASEAVTIVSNGFFWQIL